ncbi:hypothetical protein U1Q18_027450 [Sarracenia purpurea var. burkii]
MHSKILSRRLNRDNSLNQTRTIVDAIVEPEQNFVDEINKIETNRRNRLATSSNQSVRHSDIVVSRRIKVGGSGSGSGVAVLHAWKKNADKIDFRRAATN